MLAVWSVRALNLKVQFSVFFIKKNHKKGGNLIGLRKSVRVDGAFHRYLSVLNTLNSPED